MPRAWLRYVVLRDPIDGLRLAADRALRVTVPKVGPAKRVPDCERESNFCGVQGKPTAETHALSATVGQALRHAVALARPWPRQNSGIEMKTVHLGVGDIQRDVHESSCGQHVSSLALRD